MSRKSGGDPLGVWMSRKNGGGSAGVGGCHEKVCVGSAVVGGGWMSRTKKCACDSSFGATLYGSQL